MKRILVVKTGASGDVVRTTVLLRVLEGCIFWITDPYNFPLFPVGLDHLKLVRSDAISSYILDQEYDLVLNLEEDLHLAKMLQQVKARRWTGVYFDGDRLSYSPDSACWFDMSLISQLPSSVANEKKMANRLSYQECLFHMLGCSFNNEEYWISGSDNLEMGAARIALEPNSSDRWQNKRWAGYEELAERLEEQGFSPFFLKRRDRLEDYMSDIRSSSFLISGDTLAMHLALAYRIPTIAVFTCTSPQEIHDYDRLHKIVSPLLGKYFYQSGYSREAVEAITVDEVYETFAASIISTSSGRK